MIRQVSWIIPGRIVAMALLFGGACAPHDGLDQEKRDASMAGPASISNFEAGAGLSIRIDRDTASATYGSLDVEGLREEAIDILQARSTVIDWEAFFKVYAGDAWQEDASTPPVLGTYAAHPAGIRFTPRFPFVPGLTYRVYFDGATFYRDVLEWKTGLPLIVDTVFVFSEAAPFAGPLTSIRRIYPTTDSIPANQLKMYLYFTAPMAEGRAYPHLRLLDRQSGETVEAPFLEMEPELWDPDRQRFTLFFDPGRIKRLVGPNIEQGQPLREGRSYRLEIDRAWPDAKGRPLQQTVYHDFFVTAADRQKLDPKTWEIDRPAASTRDPLVLNVHEPLDHALFERAIRIFDAGGELRAGRIEIGDAERQWRFIPASPWTPGEYQIRIDAYLEDLAGNTFQSLFDVDLATAPPSEVREAEEVMILTFDIDPVTE